jgi:peptide/nickel transport system substrate-binding protein
VICRIERFVIAVAVLAATGSCLRRPTADPNIIVVSLTTGPNNLDPRAGTDDASQKIHDLIYDSLMQFDEHLRVVPKLAARVEHPDATSYVEALRHGVRFHDGHELTAADVLYTFHSLLEPAFVSAKKGGYSELASVDAVDRYTVRFTLKRAFASFLVNLAGLPIVGDGAPASIREHPVGTGPYRFVRYVPDDRLELERFPDYYGGAPKNPGVVFRIVPDDVMRGLELRKGTLDIVVNDLAPDIVVPLEHDAKLQLVQGPGLDYTYVGLNMQDALLRDVRVRQALAYAIDRQAIVEYLRRGLAVPADGMLPALSWAHASGLTSYPHDPARARALLDESGHPDPDGDGPRPRFALSLKVSNTEFNRLQSSVIQQNLREIGVDLDVRTYEFATLYADVLAGNFQLYTLQWTAGALADPDILRRVFHSDQMPPAGFNRGRFSDARVDALLDEASASTDEARRFELFAHVQRLLSTEVPYISLWHKTNIVVAQRALDGIRVTPLADLGFLTGVTRR